MSKLRGREELREIKNNKNEVEVIARVWGAGPATIELIKILRGLDVVTVTRRGALQRLGVCFWRVGSCKFGHEWFIKCSLRKKKNILGLIGFEPMKESSNRFTVYRL